LRSEIKFLLAHGSGTVLSSFFFPGEVIITHFFPFLTNSAIAANLLAASQPTQADIASAFGVLPQGNEFLVTGHIETLKLCIFLVLCIPWSFFFVCMSQIYLKQRQTC
jgi:hypothetical protein